ncbi:hypothetical protein [Trueperella pyogenes]|uniref:hypothetical protein n=1 Tax=Trueperella pyogenes TaxID=1661 RepID=UPI00345CF7BB
MNPIKTQSFMSPVARHTKPKFSVYQSDAEVRAAQYAARVANGALRTATSHSMKEGMR